MYIKDTSNFIIKYQQFKYLIIIKQLFEALLSEAYLNKILPNHMAISLFHVCRRKNIFNLSKIIFITKYKLDCF